MEKTNNAQAMSFLAIEPFRERTMVSPKESVVTGRDWLRWGDKNAYPDYIEGLSAECTTLRTIQLGLVDYIGGNEVQTAGDTFAGKDYLNGKRLTRRGLVEATGKDIAKLGGAAWELIPSKDGKLAEIHPFRMRFCRLNKEGDVLYYSEKWNSVSAGKEPLVYGRWNGEFHRNEKTGEYESAFILIKCWGDDTYPAPVYAAAVKACETERGVDEFHLGNLERGFMGSYLVNFCNGVPVDEVKRQIERDFTQKFGGASNAGRVMFNYAADKEHLAVLQKMEVADFADKYETLSKHTRQQIFTAFRANPNLFGIPTEDKGFSSEEYESAFKLFNRTIVRPIQERICEAWANATGGTMEITPFSIEGNERSAGEGANTGEE